MTQLKHIILSVLVLPAFGLVASAQSTALQPYEGATHTYAWNGLQEGVDYAFYIAADADGTTVLDDVSTGEFDFVGSPTGTVGVGESSASVAITWNHGAALHNYFVWLKVTNTSGCSNYRYVPVQPQASQFDLLSENIPVDNTVSCPAVASSDGFSPEMAEYDAGSTTLQFKIKRVNGTINKQTGSAYNWAFKPELTIDPTWNLSIAIVSIAGASSGTLTADASGLYTAQGTDDEVTVTVSVKNFPGTSQELTLKIKDQREVQTNLSDSDSSNDIVKHRIEIMPIINGIDGV